MEEALLWSFYGICIAIKGRNKRNNRRLRWSREWLLKRQEFSHVRLLRELEPDDWRNYLRMDTETYNHLLKSVTPYIERQNTCMRKAISAHERLSATLRFLATGRSYKDLEFTTIMSKPSLSEIIPETCDVIYWVLKKDFLKFPKSEQEWLQIAAEKNGNFRIVWVVLMASISELFLPREADHITLTTKRRIA
ncbi:unnamed protein product [Acanthoscelides obtectus]|uniref:Uncharacterized protein n=1 Tax=Acanthoscelides obtectus TaxID=200917 RepID=A0A9P0KH16_ACAOB|nr:unnamed protein product [Acanthoscelides obtectus]CAK1640029.1 hypothetical protein AOBTE_LOCUS11516 [Acanthoscelides obtectus]